MKKLTTFQRYVLNPFNWTRCQLWYFDQWLWRVLKRSFCKHGSIMIDGGGFIENLLTGERTVFPRKPDKCMQCLKVFHTETLSK